MCPSHKTSTFFDHSLNAWAEVNDFLLCFSGKLKTTQEPYENFMKSTFIFHALLVQKLMSSNISYE